MALSGLVSSITQKGRFEPFDLHVSRGQVVGHQYVFQFGQAATVTTNQTVWATTGVYAYPASATVMKISSGNANDTSAGTGAQTVRITGLDANYNVITEVVALNGQTSVNTTNSYLRINDFYVVSCGTGNTAAGIIYAGTGTVTSGVPATVYSLMPVAYNAQTQAIFTVPANYTAYISSYTFTSNNGTANTTCSGFLYVYQYGNNFPTIEASARFNGGNAFDRHFDYPLKFTEKTDLELRVTSSNSGQMSGEMHILLVQNGYTV